MTNPLSVAYGACGPALLLRSATSAREPAAALPAEVASWMLGQPLGTDTYPPGLYVGLAGIAWAFHDLGWEDRGEAVMAMLYESPLLYDEPGMFLGVAGWGLASLRFHVRTGKQVHLDRAVQAGKSCSGPRSRRATPVTGGPPTTAASTTDTATVRAASPSSSSTCTC